MILARLTPHEAESLLPQRSPTRKGVVNRALTVRRGIPNRYLQCSSVLKQFLNMSSLTP